MRFIMCCQRVRPIRRIKSRVNSCINSGVFAAIPAPQRAPGWKPVRQIPLQGGELTHRATRGDGSVDPAN